MTKNPVAHEPVAVQLLAGVVTYLAARYVPGLHLTGTQELAVAVGIYGVTAPFVRQLVRPVAKDPTSPLGAQEASRVTVWDSPNVPKVTTSSSGGPITYKRPDEPERPDPSRVT